MTYPNAPEGTYVSTTIPYVNGPAHVGFALEIVQADALARYFRLAGEQTWTSTGTDDHSLKNVRAAEALGIPVRELVTRNAATFAALGDGLGARYSQVVRTSSDPRHRPTVERLYRACAERGDLYRRDYRGNYCVGCEQFLRPDELVRGLCPEHQRAPEPVAEENWFFRLSRYAEPVRRAIESDELRILPESRKNEALSFIARGLEDFSVSRSAARAHGFGIPVPGDPGQVIYVWFDALANYLTAGDFGSHGPASGWHRSRLRVHVLGKGVLRFHAVYWPAILLSAGLPLPSELRVHGYLTVEGQKIGKSLGNVLEPRELLSAYGSTAVRYYLLRHIPSTADADFSRSRLIAAHDAEIAGELGNLARRVQTLLHRHADGRVPELGPVGDAEAELESVAAPLGGRLGAAVREHELGDALAAIWDLVRATNRYLELTQPWRLAASDARTRGTALAAAAGALRVLAVSVAPFLPEFGLRLADAFGVRVEPGALRRTSALGGLPVGQAVLPPTVLAPRLAPKR
jgi:methionyl-tRNA synthetase